MSIDFESSNVRYVITNISSRVNMNSYSSSEKLLNLRELDCTSNLVTIFEKTNFYYNRTKNTF